MLLLTLLFCVDIWRKELPSLWFICTQNNVCIYAKSNYSFPFIIPVNSFTLNGEKNETYRSQHNGNIHDWNGWKMSRNQKENQPWIVFDFFLFLFIFFIVLGMDKNNLIASHQITSIVKTNNITIRIIRLYGRLEHNNVRFECAYRFFAAESYTECTDQKEVKSNRKKRITWIGCAIPPKAKWKTKYFTAICIHMTIFCININTELVNWH